MAPRDTNDDDEGCADDMSGDAAAVARRPADQQRGDPLAACKEALEELKEENAELRESSESFGALAERLNRAKRSEP